MAGLYPDEEIAREHDKDLSRVPPGLEACARVESMVGEEERLLEEAEEGHRQDQRERLHTIGKELDHVWETLRRRAERRGTGKAPAGPTE